MQTEETNQNPGATEIFRMPAADATVPDLMDLTNVSAGLVTIEDLRSLNGTWVDGAIVSRASLRDGSTVQIGTFRMVFHTNARPRRIQTEA